MPNKSSSAIEHSIEARYERLKRYTEAHASMQSPKISKFFSGVYYSAMRFITLVIACALFLTFIISLFTSNYTLQINPAHDTKAITIEDCYKYIGLVCLLLGLLFLWVSTQLNKIKKKNRELHNLSEMLADMLET